MKMGSVKQGTKNQKYNLVVQYDDSCRHYGPTKCHVGITLGCNKVWTKMIVSTGYNSV